jgi:hypothetical protein
MESVTWRESGSLDPLTRIWLNEEFREFGGWPILNFAFFTKFRVGMLEEPSHLLILRTNSRSNQLDIPFDRLDHVVHLAVPDLFGHAKGETLGRVERDMRRQR